VLSVARLEKNKRVDLAVRAVPHLPPHLRLVVIGDGSDRQAIERLASDLGVADRVSFAGAASDADLIAWYRDALCLVYAPYDEDYGLATLEAFLAQKPVVTARDSGGTLEFVEDGVNGRVVEPDAAAVAAAIRELDGNRSLASAWGGAGHTVAATITWDRVLDRLLAHG
jgi:glycosyltransferase involved in cell wall biosynthesis